MQCLITLEKLISSAFSFANVSDEDGQVEAFSVTIDHAIAEMEGIRTSILNAVFRNREKKHMSLFMQSCQALCVNLSNKIYFGSLQLRSLNYRHQSIEQMIAKQLQLQNHIFDLLFFMEGCFSRYFDASQKVPVAIGLMRAAEMKLSATQTHNALEGRLSPALIKVLLSPAHYFLRSELAEASYENFSFLNTYLSALRHAASDDGQSSAIRTVMHKCIALDYCPGEFVNCYLDDLKTEADNCGSYAEKKKFWIRNVLLLSLLPVRKGSTSFLKTRLVKCMQEQLNVVELDSAGNGSLFDNAETVPEKMINTSLSVSQLGLFIRLLVETGIIKTNNHSMLLRWIASSFKTSKTVEISAESLRIKYYTTDKAAVNIVKEYVLQMMNQLRKC